MLSAEADQREPAHSHHRFNLFRVQSPPPSATVMSDQGHLETYRIGPLGSYWQVICGPTSKEKASRLGRAPRARGSGHRDSGKSSRSCRRGGSAVSEVPLRPQSAALGCPRQAGAGVRVQPRLAHHGQGARAAFACTSAAQRCGGGQRRPSRRPRWGVAHRGPPGSNTEGGSGRALGCLLRRADKRRVCGSDGGGARGRRPWERATGQLGGARASCGRQPCRIGGGAGNPSTSPVEGLSDRSGGCLCPGARVGRWRGR